MSAVENGTSRSLQPPEVGLWLLDDDAEWAIFQCDGCGGLSGVRRYDLPYRLGDECPGCGGIETHVLGAVLDSGQLYVLTTEEALAVARYLVTS